MKIAPVLLAGLLAACGEPRPEPPGSDPALVSLEAAVADCDQAQGGTRCDAAHRRLAEARRADRMAAYRQAH